MKKILFTIMMFVAIGLSAQEYETTNVKRETKLIQVDYNQFKVIMRDHSTGQIEQVGYYTLVNDALVKDGVWKMYDNNGKVITTAKFSDSRVVWIESNRGRYTSEQIELHRLRRRVNELEGIVAMGTN